MTIRGRLLNRISKSKKSMVPLSGITVRDLFNEAVTGILARPGRMMLTILGVVIGLAAVVATLGLSHTAGNRIIGQFDKLAATEVVVSAKAQADGGETAALPWDAPTRLGRLNGVVAVGNLSTIDVGDALISSSVVKDPRGQTRFKLSVQAASPGLFKAVRAKLNSGRFFDKGHSIRVERVAVLGPGAALRLGVNGVEQQPAIVIGDNIYLVMGVLHDVGRQPGLLGSVIIPEGIARHDFKLANPEFVVVETRIGAARLIAQQTPLALRPDKPSALKIASPSDPQRVRDAVKNDLSVLFLLLGGVSLFVGAIGIANITLVSVVERTGEIGLRRAIGATRWHITAQFLIESATLGFVGGIIGASFGVIIVVAVSAYQGWTPVLDATAPFLSPFVGGLIGLVAGTYPAIRGALLEPIDAIRTRN